MNLNSNLGISQGLTELKTMSLTTISGSFSYLTNTQMSIMPNAGVSNNLYRNRVIHHKYE